MYCMKESPKNRSFTLSSPVGPTPSARASSIGGVENRITGSMTDAGSLRPYHGHMLSSPAIAARYETVGGVAIQRRRGLTEDRIRFQTSWPAASFQCVPHL